MCMVSEVSKGGNLESCKEYLASLFFFFPGAANIVSLMGGGVTWRLASTMMAAVLSETRAPRLTVEIRVAMDWGRNVVDTSMVCMVVVVCGRLESCGEYECIKV